MSGDRGGRRLLGKRSRADGIDGGDQDAPEQLLLRLPASKLAEGSFLYFCLPVQPVAAAVEDGQNKKQQLMAPQQSRQPQQQQQQMVVALQPVDVSPSLAPAPAAVDAEPPIEPARQQPFSVTEDWCRLTGSLELAARTQGSSKPALSSGAAAAGHRVLEYRLQRALHLLELPAAAHVYDDDAEGHAEGDDCKMDAEDDEAAMGNGGGREEIVFADGAFRRRSGQPLAKAVPGASARAAHGSAGVSCAWTPGFPPQAVVAAVEARGLDGWRQGPWVCLLDSTLADRCTLVDLDRKPGRTQLFLLDMFAGLKL